MSWLYTIVFAGLMLSLDGGLPISTNSNYTDSVITNAAAVDETEKFEQTYPLNGSGRVSVSNVNGSIAVETWDRNEVRLEYVKTADTKENLAEVNVQIDARQDAFSVETDYGDWKRRPSGERRSYGKLQVEYRLTVPRSAVLNDIETVNGSISISNAANMTKASAVNGEVRGTNLRGTANLSTVNGTVIADFDQLQTGGRISLNTVNGTVDLMIPSDASATIKADTVNGNISNDFGLPVRKGEYVGRDLHGKVGGGDVQIRLSSVNGALSIKRKNDGKNLNPATNLLNLKNENDDEDWEDDENNSRVKPPKPPKPPKPAKVPKPPVISEIDNEEIRRSIEQSLKDANEELIKITPELEKTYAEALKQVQVINSQEMQAQIREATKYSERLARMSEVYWAVGSPDVEKKRFFRRQGTPKVKVEAGNCAVFVRGWDKPEVQYTITRLSKSRAPTPLDLKATVNGSDVDIKILNVNGAARNADFFNEMNRTRVEIFVPKKSDLKITTSGEIRLEGVSGAIELQGADEAINVRDAGGKLTVAAADGRIRVIGFRGAFDGKNGDGEMNLEGDFQNLSAQTVDGTIILTLPENANVNIESNRKDITSDGVKLEYQGDGQSASKWKVGSGGANHLLYTTADGRVFVRSASAMKTN